MALIVDSSLDWYRFQSIPIPGGVLQLNPVVYVSVEKAATITTRSERRSSPSATNCRGTMFRINETSK